MRDKDTVDISRVRGRSAQWVAGAAALAGTWAAVELGKGTLSTWETRTLAAVNGLPDSLRPGVWPVMQFGNFWMSAAAAPVGYAFGRRWQTAASWSGSAVLAWGSAKAVKRIVRRGRPMDFRPETIIREHGITGMGYVSGHSAIVFALSTVVWPCLPRGWRGVPFALASVVGLSRLYVGAHLPLDVIGGAGLGVLCGLSTSLSSGDVAIRSFDRQDGVPVVSRVGRRDGRIGRDRSA